MEAAQDFLSECINASDVSAIGKKYALLYGIRVMPTDQVVCLDMILLEKDGGVYRNPRIQRIAMVDEALFN